MSGPQTAERCADEERALIMTPFGRDSSVAAGILAEAGLKAWACTSLADLVAELDAGAGCIVITQEAVEAADIKPLFGWLDGQPSWSDLPIIMITEHGGGPQSSPKALRLMDALGNVTFLERPFRPLTFLSLVQSALRSRRRQLQARTYVAEIVKTGAELLAAEERLRLATEAADIGWWDVEEGHGELFWPPRVKAMFGISPDAPVTMDDFYTGLHPDDRERVAAVYAGAADPTRRELYDVEYRTIGKEDGIVRWVAAKGRGVFDEAGRCKRVLGTAIDITERKVAQDERLARQQEDAELRDQFIAVLGHDLRNPLASVAAGTHVLVRRPEKASEVAAHIERSIARMSELIENVLDFARGRLGGGFVITRDSEKPLQPVLLQVIEELKGVHPERDVAVDIDLLQPVACDPQRIGQLLSNLLGNAFVYGTPTSTIQVRARAEQGQFELSVANAGEAIESSALERLFQPFFRGKVRGSREGLGLGLYICSEIAKAHGGTIDVTSDNERTCFTLRMPTKA